MEYVHFGKSALRVSRVAFGCDPLGGHAWGKVDPAEIRRAVLLALDRGVNLFDTADCYGLGASEELIGAALRDRRHEAIIATKFGVRLDAAGRTFFDNSPGWLDRALDASLQRLGADYIDLYQVHYWDAKTPLSDVLGCLERKRCDGKIRWYGVTNVDLYDAGLSSVPDGCVSFSFEYSLANRRYEERVIQTHRRWGVGFLSWGSLGQGVLSGNYDESSLPDAGDRRNRLTYVNFHGEGLRRSLSIVRSMRECLAAYPGMTLTQLAIRWILDYLGFGVALVGIKSPQQLRENAGASDFRLLPEHLASLERSSRPQSGCERAAEARDQEAATG